MKYVYDDRVWLEATARRMARGVCGTRWAHHLEDATQEALIAAWGCARGKKPREVQAVAARRAAVDYLQRMCGVRFQRAALVETVEIGQAEFYREMAVEESGFAAVDDDDAFEAMLALLPVGEDGQRYRRILRAVMRERVSQEEVAEREGISQGWVSRLLAEALGVLREAIGGDPEMVEPVRFS